MNSNSINNVATLTSQYYYNSGGYYGPSQTGLQDCYDSSLGGQVCSDYGIVYSITDDPSDSSFKDNIKNLTLDLGKFSQIIPSEWTWANNFTGKQGQPSTGLVADNIESIYPSLVKTGQHKEVIGYKNTTNTNNVTTSEPIWNTTTYKTIDYAGIISLQTAKIQQLESQNEKIAQCAADSKTYEDYQTCVGKV
jgi:hypothetical protein